MQPDRSMTADSPLPRGPTVRRAVTGGLTALALFVLLSACAAMKDAASPDPDPSCLIPGTHCEYDAQCCSGRCYHETGCVGGTP
jgi:hypothetical protein